MARYSHRGSAGALGQAAFVGLVAFALRLLGVPVIPVLCLALAAALALGAAASWMTAWDLRLDMSRRRFILLRGPRGARRRVEGSFDDLRCVLAAPAPYDGCHLYLVPAGSRRGYDVARGFDRAAARSRGLALARSLGRPFEEAPVLTPVPRVDLRSDPLPGKVGRRVEGNGVVLDISPSPRLWRQSLRVDDEGLALTTELLLPWGASPTRLEVRWSDATQILIQPYGGDDLTGLRGARLRLRPDWREDLRSLWLSRCAELGEPPAEEPSWAPLWYWYEGRPFEREKCIYVVRRRGRFVGFGSDWDLGPGSLEWLRDGLLVWARRRNPSVAGDL